LWKEADWPIGRAILIYYGISKGVMKPPCEQSSGN
jgi:hypothetical protein